MAQLFANNARTTLAVAALIGDSSLAVVDGSHFPSPTGGDFFLLTLTSGNPEALWEIVKVTARSGNTVTVIRAQEGTTAQAWALGTKCELRLTAGALGGFQPVLGFTPINKAGDTGVGALVSSPINPLTTAAESWIGPSAAAGIYFKNGNVGLGDSNPIYPLTVKFSSTATVSQTSQFMTLYYNPSTDTATFGYCAQFIAQKDGTANMTGSYGSGGLVGTFYKAVNNGTGTVSNAYGLISTIQNLAAGIITNGYSLYIPNGYKPLGTITNLYAIKIENQTAGSTNYALYTGTGLIHLGDTTASTSSITGALTVAGGLGVSGAGYFNGALTATMVNPGTYTVATLPAGTNGASAYASNGRKVGEGAGAGTGSRVVYSNGAWRRLSDETVITA